MPRILELKNIDGQMWARLDLDLNSEDQPVTLWTASEVRETTNRLLDEAIGAIKELKA